MTENTPISLLEPHKIYWMKLEKWEMDFEDGNPPLRFPVLEINAKTVMGKVVQPIRLPGGVVLNEGDQVLLSSVYPNIDGNTGTLTTRLTCSTYVPHYTSRLADPYCGLPAEKIELIEGYDSFGNDYSGEILANVFRTMEEKYWDSTLVSATEYQSEVNDMFKAIKKAKQIDEVNNER